MNTPNDELFNDFDDLFEDATESAEPTEKTATSSASRPFTVKTRKTKQKYTFKHFTSARQGTDLFADSAGTLQEKSDLYEEVAFALESLKDDLEKLEKNDKIIANGGTIISLVPINFITVDPEWCRQKRVDWNHVAEIAMHYRAGSLSLPTITFRKIFSPTGKLQNVILSLTDGVHRTAALRELGHTHVRALVQIVEELKDEAQMYSDLNYNRRAHAKRDIYRARVAYEDESLMDIVRLVESYGFSFPSHAGMKCSWPDIGAIQTVEKLYHRYGPEILGRVFELLGDKAFVEWHGNNASITADMISGFAMFVEEFERPGFVHSNMTRHFFKSTTPNIVSETANNISRVECDGLMNRQVCENSTTFNSQEARAVKHCCAIVKKIKELFKPSKRPADEFTPKFKEAFDLFYTADKEHRLSELLHLRKFFAKKKMADYWFAKTNSDLVR